MITYVCLECGERHGKRHFLRDMDEVDWKLGTCVVCGLPKMVTDAKDFGGLKPWVPKCGTCDGRLN
jgi:hypothetical protein